MLRLLDRARVLLVEDAMRFAVGLYVATHTPRTVDQREKIRTQCEVCRAKKQNNLPIVLISGIQGQI